MTVDGTRPGARPQLSARDLSILHVAIAATQNRSAELPELIACALRNGASRDEIRAVVEEVTALAGDRAADSIEVAEQVISNLEQ